MSDLVIKRDLDQSFGQAANDNLNGTRSSENSREKSFADSHESDRISMETLWNCGLAYDGNGNCVCIDCGFVLKISRTVRPPDIETMHRNHNPRCSNLLRHLNSGMNNRAASQGNTLSDSNSINSFVSSTENACSNHFEETKRQRTNTTQCRDTPNQQTNRNINNLHQNKLRPHSIDHDIQNPDNIQRFQVDESQTIESLIEEKIRSSWSQRKLSEGISLRVLERYWEIQIKCGENSNYESSEELAFLDKVEKISSSQVSVPFGIQAKDSVVNQEHENRNIDALILSETDIAENPCRKDNLAFSGPPHIVRPDRMQFLQLIVDTPS